MAADETRPGHVDPVRPRLEHRSIDPRRHVLIIGTGFAGIGMAIRLKRLGIQSFTILERAHEVGGTWRDNHYPGATCDVPSHLYSFSFEPNPNWSHKFARQQQIWEYLRHCANKYKLRGHIRFGAAVQSARFDETEGLWQVRTADGRSFRARIMVAGCGGLMRPKIPDLSGLGNFVGSTFHSARWNHDFDCTGKNVAVVGTGASAIQILPQIAPKAARLHLFQRSPAWVLPKGDRPIRKFEQNLFARAPIVQRLWRNASYWKREFNGLGFFGQPRILKLARRMAMEHIEHFVADPVLRAKMTPSYAIGCKRILLSDDYYPTVTRSNVEVVTAGIDRIDTAGIYAKDGTYCPTDAIIFATGFHAAEDVVPFTITGRDGADLATRWRDGAEATLGVAAAGFPNLFFIIGPNSGLGHNSMVFMIETQLDYVIRAIRVARDRNLKSIEIRPQVQTAYNQDLHARLAQTVWASGCSSWYQTSTGKNTTLWPGLCTEYWLRTRRLRLADYELGPKDV